MVAPTVTKNARKANVSAMLRFESHLMPRLTPLKADHVDAHMMITSETNTAAPEGLPSTDSHSAPDSENRPLASWRAP